MKKRAVSILILISVFFACISCTPQVQVSPTVEATASPTANPTFTSTPQNLNFTKYISADSIQPFEMTPELLEKANSMPAASNSSLPAWHGMTMDNMGWLAEAYHTDFMTYQYQDVANAAGFGFNFLRAPLDVAIIFKDGDSSKVNAAALQNMDNLLIWGIQNHIHICFDVHNTPGFSTDGDDSNDILFQNEDQQGIFENFWKYIAQRYAAVPNNALSFDLLNEPHGDTLDDATYSSVMLKAIDAIRSVTPDRLIFADMMTVGTVPVQGLVASGVVQSIHSYIPGFSEENYSATNYVMTQSWPIYVIHGMVKKQNGPLVFKGHFPTGSKLVFRIGSFQKNGDIVVTSNGSEIGRFKFGNEKPGQNHCLSIDGEGSDNEYRNYSGAGFEVKIPADTDEISFDLQGKSDWYFLFGISIISPEHNVLIITQDFVPDKDIPLEFSLSDQGVLTANDPEILSTIDETYYDRQMQNYVDFAKKNGIQLMVQEFGIDNRVDYQVTLKALDAQLSAFEKNGLSWCLWDKGFDYLATQTEYRREGANYQQISEDRFIAVEMLDVLKKYIH